MADMIIGGIVFVVVALAARKVIKDLKSRKSSGGCSGGCSGCSGGCC